MHKQLNEVVSGKQKQSLLSSPMRLFAQDFIDGRANDLTVSPERTLLLHAHLSKYVHQIPLYLQKRINSKSMQYECQPQKTVEESQLIKRKSKESWLKKQVTKRKGIITLESPLAPPHCSK